MNSNKVTTIIERVKWHSKGLNDQEKEMLRDELLTLMFSKHSNEAISFGQPDVEKLKGLTDEEKQLIKKLASQTDQLYKIRRNDENRAS